MHTRRIVDEKGNLISNINPLATKMVDEKGNHLFTGKNPVKIEQKNQDMPIAIPETTLQFESLFFDSYPLPTSIGSDGAVYGNLGGTKTGKIFRSADGFKTVEEGEDFSKLPSPNNVIFVTKLGDKYIVITRNVPQLKGAIYTSDSFTSGFTKVLDMTTGYPDRITISWYHGKLYRNKVLLVGEYGQTGTVKKLYATFNGGENFNQIKSTTVVNSDQNSHWHHSVYDPYRARVWASQGDGDNARLSYSDDMGTTWKDVEVPINDYGIARHQPTLMVPTSNKLLMSPDADSINPAVLSIPIDTSHVSLNGERFGLNWEHTVWDQDYCFLHYGQPPYVYDKTDIYMQYPNFNNKRKHHIIGSGDGGATFHNVLTVDFGEKNGTSFGEGLVGVDSLGFFYAYIVDVDLNPRILKFKKINWKSK